MKTCFTRRSFSHIRRRFSNQISITSQTGVGKTTIINGLKKILGEKVYEFVSAGGWMREKAQEKAEELKEHGYSPDILGFSAYNVARPEKGYDEECDAWVHQQGMKNFVVGEGRLTHIFMPQAFKVLLVCPIHTRAHRRSSDKKQPFESVLKDILMRDVNDGLRLEEKYPGCMWPKEHFDLVIDTGVTEKDQPPQMILDAHAEWVERMKKQRRIRWDRI